MKIHLLLITTTYLILNIPLAAPGSNPQEAEESKGALDWIVNPQVATLLFLIDVPVRLLFFSKIPTPMLLLGTLRLLGV